jgi:hypothetical protein
MAVPEAADGLDAASLGVRRACDLLVTPFPETLNACEAALRNAATDLAHSKTGFREERSRADLLLKARQLRADVLRASRLLRSAADFYFGWERILGAMSGGYTASGEPASVEHGARICCRG